ncbi:MAG: LamG domain-containing protein, partial [Planctomycetales bacterium]|nr:LamG domain-containing protein [Planctomycetales bacterium]
GILLAVQANFSMQYFGGELPVSADYFGRFCDELELALSPGSPVDMVAIMSHGCSGDIWRRDYLDPQSEAARSVEEFASGLSEIAIEAYRTVEFQSDPALSMLESRIPMRYRVPDAQRLQWARKVVDEMESKLPTTQPEIYAREQIFLDAMQSTEIVTQAICIGDIGIVTTPTETYALTGLKMKLQSPLEKTMVIELANGGDGYIPPPEQHVLGGYNTWAARSAGLEITAEPKVIARNLLMLEEIAQLPRRQFQQTNGPTALSILELNPKAYWRMHDWSPMEAIDVSGNECHGRYESGVVFFLEGPDSNRFSDGKVNRCAHFAGGRMSARLDLRESYTIVLSCWNGMPLDSRNITGWMLSHDRDDVVTSAGLHLGLDRRGRLIVQVGEHILATGEIAVPRWTWNQVALVRKPAAIQVYLNGSLEVECAVPTTAIEHLQFPTWFFGGRSDNDSNWEGRLDEIAVFDRALDSQALGRLFR